jgi:hypothetical protein
MSRDVNNFFNHASGKACVQRSPLKKKPWTSWEQEGGFNSRLTINEPRALPAFQSDDYLSRIIHRMIREYCRETIT